MNARRLLCLHAPPVWLHIGLFWQREREHRALWAPPPPPTPYADRAQPIPAAV